MKILVTVAESHLFRRQSHTIYTPANGVTAPC